MPGKIELLAPAGSIEGFYAVLNAGCDAIYVGADRFSARAYADHPQTEELIHAIDEAHLRGVKVYLTVNTLFKEDEMNELDEFIRPYYEAGLDAVLVQDFGVLRYLHKNYPDLPLHASTQMTVSGPASANLLKKYGVSRVVPARELSLKELKKIHDETGLEVEAFVHGALCYSYSGQCLMSSLIGGRSGNRGRCAQPCRLMYESSHKEGSLLSLKDLCTVDRLKDLKDAGVISLKIEGRMKQSAYAAGVVSVYRQVLDQIDERGQHSASSHGDNKKKRKAKNNPEDILRRLFSREGFTQGYLDGHNSTDMMAFNQHTGSVKSDESLLDQMKQRYVHEPEPIGINGIASFFTGRQPSLSVSYGNSVAYVEGQTILEKASNQVMSEERIKERLCKTGGTSFVFEDIEVYTEGDPFIPVKVINELRREALEGLRTALTDQYHRTCKPVEKSAPTPEIKSDADHGLSVSIETEEQVRIVLQEENVSRIYYPYHLLLTDKDPLANAAKVASAIKEAGKEAYIKMPAMVREEPFLWNKAAITGQDLINAGFDGFLVCNFESLAKLCDENLADRCMTDARLYTWNRQAFAFMKDRGVKESTAPVELNYKELAELAGLYKEIIVYGHLPMMTTANCLWKNTRACQPTPEGHTLFLKDRKHQSMPVKAECASCYNVIYNSVPLSLADEAAAIAKLGPTFYRLSFTIEDASTCRQILSDYVKTFVKGQAIKPDYPRTKGHFRRGVE